MKPKSRAPEQDDLLRPRLTDMIDLRHELVKLVLLSACSTNVKTNAIQFNLPLVWAIRR